MAVEIEKRHVDLTYSIADQNFKTTKSIGIYNFSRDLAKSLATHPEIRSLSILSNRTIDLGQIESGKTQLEECNSPLTGKVGRILWDQWGVYRAAAKSGKRWLFLPKGFCSFIVRPPCRVAAYVHDVMGDYYQRCYPHFVSRLESEYFARSLSATLRRASVIFTNTDFSKEEMLSLARRKGITEPEITVAGYGFEKQGSAEQTTVEKEDRILLFASRWPHKRTDIALSLLKEWLRASGYQGVIDCIGIISPEMEKPQGSNWNWVGRVPSAEGREMIRRARAVIYVSEYEGFGMPPVEAILEGTCPVYSNIPPLREVMGDVGCPFANDSPASFVEAMNTALQVSPETIRQWSESLLRRHNWPNVTEAIVRRLSAA